MKHIIALAQRFYLPLLSGVFIGTSYIPFPPWASLFCFVPLWVYWQQQTRLKDVLLGGMITASLFTLIGFNWLTYLLHEFAHVNWLVAGIGMLVYSIIGHLFVVIAGLIWFLGQRYFQWSPKLSLGLMALITVLSERYSFTLFDWNFGYTWYGSNIPFYQWAEFVGFSGLSAITLLLNLPLYIAWQRRREPFGIALGFVVMLGFISLNVGGERLKNRLPKPDATLTALLVQGNTSNAEKMAAELGDGYHNEIFKRYLALTDEGLANSKQKIDFALWPETAFPGFLKGAATPDPNVAVLSSYLRDRQIPLVTGAYGIKSDVRKVTNSLYVINQYGEVTEPHYSKTILMAFGEYIPGEQWLGAIRNWLPTIGQFARGDGPTRLLILNNYKMGAQICYEGLFPDFTRQLADLGAQFIVNTTNDSWYGTWQEPYQHFYMTLARAIEFRRPVLRATNTGISSVALASGEILERSPIHQQWSGSYIIPYLTNPPETFYQRWFKLVPSLLWGALVVLLGIGVYCKITKPE